MSWWVHEYYQAGLVVLLVSQIFWVIFSITLHELAHGWAAIWQGDRTPILLGHMNMNPLVHMGPMSLIIFAIVGIAWGAMPVDPSRFRWGRKGRAVVSAAGPAMNAALAVVAFAAMVIWMKVGPVDTAVYRNITTFLFVGAWLNVVLMLFNLIPAPPLDGSGILAGLSFNWYRMIHQTNAPMIGMFILLALMVSGILGHAFVYIMAWIIFLGDTVGQLVDNPPVRSTLQLGF